MAYLGIDFGNSNCVVAWWDARHACARAVELAPGQELLPSLVVYENRSCLCGLQALDKLNEARQRGELALAEVNRRTFADIKQHLGQVYFCPVPQGKKCIRDVSPREGAAVIMKRLKELAENRALQVAVSNVVLTRPVAFSEAQHAELQGAARDAGFRDIRLVSEPQAAALAYMFKCKRFSSGVIVLDIGAGSTDLCYLRCRELASGQLRIERVSQVPGDGSNELGGLDFDQCLYDYWNEEAKKQGKPLCPNANENNPLAIWQCREAKEKLSDEPVATLQLAASDASNDCALTISESDFAEIIRPKVKDIAAYLRKMINTVRQARLPLETVLLVGGPSRIPCIERECAAVIAEDRSQNVVRLVCANDSTTLVACGAAIYGAMQSGEVTVDAALSPQQVVLLPGKVSMELLWCPDGSFIMGSPAGEVGRYRDETRHRVTLSHGFWLAKYPVTQAQFRAVMGRNPSCFKDYGRPVENVTWDEARAFCERLNKLVGSRLPQGYRFALPTEAQWEYACRAGTKGAFANLESPPRQGDCAALDSAIWYYSNSRGTTHPVGQKNGNAWGFCDMHGNVWEWCRDWYGEYPQGNARNPTGSTTGTERVRRGGSWAITAQHCRSACRSAYTPSEHFGYLGFRLALTSL